MQKIKVFQFNTELFKVTGIQRVLMDIHEALKDEYEAKIVGNTTFNKINKDLDISENDYIRFRNPLVFRNSVIIIHERRLLPLMWVLTHFPGLNIKCVYIHHNELYGNKKLSLFPSNIVAISDAGIKNLKNYFGVPDTHITKIHNCVRLTSISRPRIKEFNTEDITILYPARINHVKRQIEIANNLKGRLDPRIKILFAGIGPQYEELQSLCKDSTQFRVLGFRNDITKLMEKCDFIMLFSSQEGLPISLIEGAAFARPLICNNVGGNYEIAQEDKNLIKVSDWETLISTINELPYMSKDTYRSLSENSRKIYMTNFTFVIFKDKYIRLIKQIYENA